MNTQQAKNVDPQELNKFDAGGRWWDEEGPYKTLHQINPLRRDWIVARSGPLQGLQVLDVGCGGGILAESLAQKGASVTGIDLGQGQIEAAHAHAKDAGLDIDYQLVSVEDLAADRPGEFDVVTCMEMLEHVPDPGSIIKACATLVKPGGSVFFSTINRNPKAFALAIIGAEYMLNLLPKGTHEYAKFIRPSELESWAREAGLILHNIKGITYNPLLQSYKLSGDIDINYMMYFTKEQ